MCPDGTNVYCTCFFLGDPIPGKTEMAGLMSDSAPAEKKAEVDSEEEDDDYVPVDDDEDAAEDDAYEALAGGDDPDDPGASLNNMAWLLCLHGGALSAAAPALVDMRVRGRRFAYVMIQVLAFCRLPKGFKTEHEGPWGVGEGKAQRGRATARCKARSPCRWHLPER